MPSSRLFWIGPRSASASTVKSSERPNWIVEATRIGSLSDWPFTIRSEMWRLSSCSIGR